MHWCNKQQKLYKRQHKCTYVINNRNYTLYIIQETTQVHLCTVIIANTLLEPSWIVRIKKEKSPWPVPSQNLSITPGHFPFDILHVRLIWSFWYRRTAVYPNSYCPVIGLPIKRIDVTQTALLQLVLKVFLADKTMSHDWNPQVQSIYAGVLDSPALFWS